MTDLQTQQDDAPRRARHDDKDGSLAYVGRSVLINRPRQVLFAFWKDFQNLPRFMHSIEAIRTTGENRAVWTVKAPAGQTVELETEVTELVEPRVIAWQSTDASQIATRGKVTFEDAPAGRGTIVTAEIAYEPPAGELGRLVAKLFGEEPQIQARRELKRFKMLMETGEIADSAYHRH